MNILVVDDHALVRRGLIQLLMEEFISCNVTEASNSVEVNAKVLYYVWDVILLDISMVGDNGIDILKQLRASGIKAPILMLSMHPDDIYAMRVLNEGASGFLNKNNAPDELINAIETILSGKKYITPALGEILAASDFSILKPAHDLLSDRELQIFRLLACGNSVAEIALSISLGAQVVNTYQTRIMEKMKFTSNIELKKYALENEL